MPENKSTGRVLFAGTSSGCGKTTVVCGLLSAFKQSLKDISACKCGPDYIDPMFYKQIIGIPSQNIDLFFAGKELADYLLSRMQGITIIEGVMGFYDGYAMDSVKASSYDIARNTKTPVILIVNCKGMAYSAVPIIKGIMEFRADSNIKGVILNCITEITGRLLSEIIERELHLKVYGCIPVMEEFVFKSRHLGLVTPYEINNIKEQMDRLGNIIARHINLKGIEELASTAPDINASLPPAIKKCIEARPGKGIRAGIAWDKAFCFYYKENLLLLEELGCELVWFSPLKDKKLPEGLGIIFFGGGYPEVYAGQLSSNKSMLKSVKDAVESGIICVAECGGFMYLHDYMEDENRKLFKMAGIIKGRAVKKEKLVRFGYITLKSNGTDVYLDSNGIKAHEFHYWDSDNNGSSYTAVKPSGKRQWECMHVKDNIIAGFPHLYYYSNVNFISNILKKARDFIKARKDIR